MGVSSSELALAGKSGPGELNRGYRTPLVSLLPLTDQANLFIPTSWQWVFEVNDPFSPAVLLARVSKDEACEGPALQFPSECATRSCCEAAEFSRPLARALWGSALLVPGPLFRASLVLQVVVTVLAHPHRGGDFQTLDFGLEATASEERNMKGVKKGGGGGGGLGFSIWSKLDCNLLGGGDVFLMTLGGQLARNQLNSTREKTPLELKCNFY